MENTNSEHNRQGRDSATASATFLHETAIADEGCEIGEGTKVWHFSHISKGATIGRNCNIGQNVYVAPGARIGDGAKIQNNVSVYDGVEIEDDVFLGPSMVFTNVINPRAFVSRKHEFRKTIVRRGASIGANATIVCGVEIGEYAMVGAGAVITKDVPPYALMVGVPARRTGWVSRNGCKLEFREVAEGRCEAVCAETGEKYAIANNRVRLITEEQ